MHPDQITYAYFCTLGGLQHPRTYTRLHDNGGYYYTTTYYLSPKVDG